MLGQISTWGQMVIGVAPHGMDGLKGHVDYSLGATKAIRICQNLVSPTCQGVAMRLFSAR